MSPDFTVLFLLPTTSSWRRVLITHPEWKTWPKSQNDFYMICVNTILINFKTLICDQQKFDKDHTLDECFKTIDFCSVKGMTSLTTLPQPLKPNLFIFFFSSMLEPRRQQIQERNWDIPLHSDTLELLLGNPNIWYS